MAKKLVIPEDGIQLHHGWDPADVQANFIRAGLYEDWEEIVLLGGRGGGKDLSIGSMVVDFCVQNDDVQVLFVCAYYSQIRNFWNQVLRKRNREEGDRFKGHYFVPQLFTINESLFEINFMNGSKILCRSAERPESIDSTRSDLIIINEAKFIYKEQQLNSILGTLRKGAKVVWVSSAGGKNLFYEKYVSGLKDPTDKYYIAGKTSEKVISFKVTYHNNPKQASNLASLKRTMTTAMWLSLMEGEFLDGNSVFMDLDQAFFAAEPIIENDVEKWKGEEPIKEQVVLALDEKGNQVTDRFGNPLTKKLPAAKYVMGVDYAQSVDYTVIFVMNVVTGRVVYYERFNRISYNLVAKKTLEVAHHYNDAVVAYDATGVGKAVGDALVGCQLKYNEYRMVSLYPQTFTNAIKAEMIQTLALRIESKNEYQVFIPSCSTIIQEMRNLEGDVTKTGLPTYKAPDGQHDDTVMALALCNWLWDGNRPSDFDGFQEVQF